MPCPKFITCAAHARFRQRIRDINSTKSSKTAIRENFDPTKFSAIRYSLQPVGNHWKEAKNMQICFIIIISVQCFQLIMFIRVVHTLLVFILLASGMVSKPPQSINKSHHGNIPLITKLVRFKTLINHNLLATLPLSNYTTYFVFSSSFFENANTVVL